MQLKETPPKPKVKVKIKDKPCKQQPKKTGIAISGAEKTDFKAKISTRNRSFIMTRGLIDEESYRFKNYMHQIK